MFAKTIIDSDSFLDMPLSAQALYFHLAMRADDDGFINNPRKIQRVIGCGNDDMTLLIAKSFIIPFDSGIVVIKHWRIHNYIRGDRKKDTAYAEEMSQLLVKDNGAYTLNTATEVADVWDTMSGKCLSSGGQVADMCLPSGSQATDMCHTQVRLGKDRLGKDRDRVRVREGCKGEEETPLVDGTTAQDDSDATSSPSNPSKPQKAKPQKHRYGEYQHVLLTDDELSKLNETFGETMTQKAITFLDEHIEMKGYKAKSHYLAIRKWVVDAVKEKERKDQRQPYRPAAENKGTLYGRTIDEMGYDDPINQALSLDLSFLEEDENADNDGN